MMRDVRILGALAAVLALSPGLYAKESGKEKVKAPMDAAMARKEIIKEFGFVPKIFGMLPSEALPGAWMELKGLEMTETAIPMKYKGLISLAVAGQAGCEFCTALHAEKSRIEGASMKERSEAVAMASQTRHWSTYLNGSAFEMASFKAETDRIMEIQRERLRKMGQAEGAEETAETAEEMPLEEQAGVSGEEAGSVSPRSPVQAVYQDIEKTLGMVPTFLKTYPEEGIAGAWSSMKSVELNPDTAIPPKYKELIGLAVAAQIPCSYCTYFHTESAKFHGATEKEIRETLALSSVTRYWSTAIGGHRQDERMLKSELPRLVSALKKNRASRAQLGGEAAVETSAE